MLGKAKTVIRVKEGGLGLAARALDTLFSCGAVSVDRTRNTDVSGANPTTCTVGTDAAFTGTAGAVQAELAKSTFAVLGAGGAGVGLAYLAVTTVDVAAAVTHLASSAKAELANTALAIGGTGGASVAGTNLTGCAVAVAATVTHQTNRLDADLPGATFVVKDAVHTAIVPAGQALSTIGHCATACSLAHSGQTELAGAALGVLLTSATFVVEANLST